ncbi:MAG: phosphotransferase [Candidatus Dojkabacteria bacterium]
MNSTETTFTHGQSNSQVVKVENTVRRTLGPNSEFVHQLLKLLEAKSFQYAPKYLGTDDRNREILSFIPGVLGSEVEHTFEHFKECMHVLKQYHDATAGSALAGSSEVVCHNDFALWNLLFENNYLSGVIDFDDAAPGKRVDDVAYAIWTLLEVGSSDDPEIVSKIVELVNVYGNISSDDLIEAFLSQMHKILAKRKDMAVNSPKAEVREMSKGRISEIEDQIRWVVQNSDKIIETFRHKL